MTEKYTPLCCAEKGILHLPDEILTQIILLLSPRERVPLGNSCRRLKTLVFEDPKLMKYLDFSKKAGLIKMAHIQQYFSNENSCQHVRRVDASYVDCLEAGDSLNNSIGRAINLVELDIHGTKFEDVWQLDSFLKPLQRLEKLSIDWPRDVGTDISICERIFHRPFSKLTYLSVRLEISALRMVTSTLSLCPRLVEVDIEALDFYEPAVRSNFWNSDIKRLKNLKIVRYEGREAIKIKEELAGVLPDPERWTDFQLCGADPPDGFYIEKDIEVCEELLRCEWLDDFLDTAPWDNFKFKWALNPEYLLEEVLEITHEDVPEDWCCLSTHAGGQEHFLKIEEAKRLLKDPRYQISYLYLNHDLERHCDAHLLVSAFPNLSELVLHGVTSKSETLPKHSHSRRRLRRRCGPVPEEQDDSPNLDSSFKMLVENTPHLKHFTLDGWLRVEDWDFGTLCLISGWQRLETLTMTCVPPKDGQFLIEIGKRCKNLQELSIENNPSGEADCDEFALFEMLKYCCNLREFTISDVDIDQTEMFNSLAKNVNLESVEARDSKYEHSATLWISSLEKMIRQCEKLTTIICHLKFKTRDDCMEAVSAVKRIRGECRRPDFEINVSCWSL